MKKACPRKSVGGILKRDGEIYLIDRRHEPLGWACPSGHLDEGKTPEEMIGIEFNEEIGLRACASLFLVEEMLSWNNCWRSNGEGHYWYVFAMDDPGGEPVLDPREARGGGWFKPEEIQHLELEPAWRYWLEKLGYINKPGIGYNVVR